MRKWLRDMSPEMRVYVLAILFSALALGLSDAVYSNYFKEAYSVTAYQRGLIEFPRELPGILCVFIAAALSFLGETKLIVFAQAAMLIGVLVLGLVTPPFGVMLIFLFINSLGMHIAMPLQDSIGMKLAEPGAVGRRMGMYNGVRTAASMCMGLLVFFGFRSGFFSFKTPVKWIFIISALLCLCSFLAYYKLHRTTGSKAGEKRKVKLVFRKEYKYFYLLAVTRGIQKQICYVYAPWIIIELLGRGADTTAILGVCGAAIGIFYLPTVGRWIDKFGVAKLLIFESIGLIAVYLCYAGLSGALGMGALGTGIVPLVLACALYMIDRTITSMGMVRTVYVRSIVKDANEVTPVLSTGLSVDHVVSISCAYLGGLIWASWGPSWVFLLAAVLSLGNLAVALLIRRELAQKQASATLGA